jgi:aminopeptidase N
MPSETDIARDIGRDVDPDAIFAARFALRTEIGRRLAAALARIYEMMFVPGPYRPDAQSCGRRSLRNTCLDLLVTARDDGAITRAMRQYEGSDNMTDRLAALSTLSLCDVPERNVALDDFYARHRDDPLIVDKWFSLQAFIPEAGTLDRVKALTAHPAFSSANPNRVRSLIGAFAAGNQTQFNRADGAGYDFIVDHVLQLDRGNPQLAARLLSSLKSWRALEPVRRAHAQAALQRVANTPTLSRDVSDIVHRALAAD